MTTKKSTPNPIRLDASKLLGKTLKGTTMTGLKPAGLKPQPDLKVRWSDVKLMPYRLSFTRRYGWQGRR